MAYKVADPIVLTPKVVNDTTYTPSISTLGLTLVNDDWIILYVHTHATTGTLSVAGSGWSELVELDVTSGGQMAVYACKVAAGTVPDPTIIATVTTTWQLVLEQWRDADTTTFAEIPTPTQANAASVASATFTPAADDCTIVYFGAVRGSTGQHCRFLSDKVVAAANPQVVIGTTFFAMAVGTVQQAARAATSETMYAEESGRIGCITLAVKNKTGGKVSRDGRAAMTKVGWFGDYGTVHESLSGFTFNAPSTFCVWGGGTERLAGINLATALTGITTTHATTGLPPLNGKYSDMASAVNTAAEWSGIWWATPSTLDMTGKIFTIEWFMSQLGDNVGSNGVVIAFGDDAAADTGNAVVFQLAPKLSIPNNTLLTSHIALETGTQFAAIGSINWATVKKIGIFYHRAGSSTASRSVSFRNMFLHGNTVMTGGNPTIPLNGQFLHNVLNGWGYTGLCTKSGDAMLAKTSFTFGDASKPTYVDTTATLINTPASYSTNAQALWNVPLNTVTIGVNAASGDTMRFVASAIAAGAGAEQNFTVTAASGATVSTQGGVFGNLLWTGHADFDPTGATYSGCDEVAWRGATVTNCTVTDTTSTDAAASVDANTTITNTTIDGTGALYALELGASVTAITLADCPLTAGSTNKVHVLATSGTVVITISGSTVLDVGSVTSAGATVEVSAPVVTADISITGMPDTVGANTRLQIINQTAAAAAQRANSTAYSAGDVRLRQTGVGTENTAGLYLRCTTSGTSAGTPPTWNTTVGGTTTDGTVVWTTYAVLYYDADPAATSFAATYIDGEEFLAGETIEIRFAEEDPAASFKTYSTSVLAATTGFSALVNETADDVYATYGLSGADYETTFSPDYTNDYILLDTNTNFSGASAFAYYCYLLTSSQGMYQFWGGLTALDSGNIRINTAAVSLYFDESGGFVRQTDDVRIFRDDGVRPAIDPTTGGAGIEINWRTPVNVVSTGGSALTPSESAQLMSLPSASANAAAVWAKTLP